MRVLPQTHTGKEMRYMPFVAALLFFYCHFASTVFPVTAAHRCIFDSIAEEAGPPSTAIVRELPHRGRSGLQLLIASEPEWKPMRIKTFAEDINNKLRYCTKKGQWRPNFRGGGIYCQEEDILTREKREIIVNHILPQAIRLHAERLCVQPMTNPIVVPKDMPYRCFQFTVPNSHHTEGVKDADLVLYVAAGSTRNGTFAWAFPCAELRNGRPIVGVINLNPSEVSSTDYFVRVAAHEIAHVLGFSNSFMNRLEMITELRYLRGKPSVHMVKSPRVVEKTRAYYNCPAAPGMELEDEGGVGTAGSHWEMRNAKDELMSGIFDIGYYSTLTMAFFEDLKIYRANWTMAETMNWGRNSGCRLLTMKCVINGTTAYPDMFCTDNSDENIPSCTSSRLALGYCPIHTYQNLPPWHQYLKDPHKGGAPDSYADFCPFFTPFPHMGCTDGKPGAMPGSRVGRSSRCLKGDNLYHQGTHIGDVCAEVQCHNDGRLSVRYLGNDAWLLCPEGNYITPKGGFTGGRIMCPKYSDVCIETGRDKSPVDLSPMKVMISGRNRQRARRRLTQ